MSELPAAPAFTDVPENGQWMEPDKADESLNVRFYENPLSGEEHIEIQSPGDDKTVHDTPVNDWYKARFRQKWENYQAQRDNYAGQTRLETVNWIDPGMCKDMAKSGLHTVEQLAGISDGSISQTNMIGLMSFREKAIKHLEDLKKSSEYDELKDQNAMLLRRLEALEQDPPVRKGRRVDPEKRM